MFFWNKNTFLEPMNMYQISSCFQCPKKLCITYIKIDLYSYICLYISVMSVIYEYERDLMVLLKFAYHAS